MPKNASSSTENKRGKNIAAKSIPKGKSLGMSHPIIAVGYVLIAYMLPVVNAALTIVIPIIWHIPTTLSYISLFAIYFISLGLLWFLNKLLSLKKVSDEDNIISRRGFVKTFPLYAIAVLFIPMTSNPLSLAIGTGGLLLYYQYITEYVSKMF